MQIQWKNAWVLFVVLAACNPHTQNTSDNTTVNSTPAQTKEDSTAFSQLKVEPFVPPSAIEGCTGLYAGDSTGLMQQQYLFAASYSGTAFVKLNGQLQQLTLQDRNNNSSQIKEIYTANNLTVTITVTQQQRSGDEVWLYRGIMMIESNGAKIKMDVWGEVGC